MAKKKSNAGPILAGVAAAVLVGGVAGGIAWAATKKKSSGSKGADDPNKRDPIEPRPGVGGKGKVWVDDDDYKKKGKTKPTPPEGFDYAGNQIWISPDCGYVIEGNLFWQSDGGVIMSDGAETVDMALAMKSAPDIESPDNSVLGFVEYMIEELGVRDPQDAVWEIIRQVSPLCADVDPNKDWGPGMYNWFQNFSARMVDFFEETLGAIGFDPDAPTDADDEDLDDFEVEEVVDDA